MSFNLKQCGGAALAILTSLAYIVNIYLVKLFQLTASSISLTRGVLQILVFSVLLLKSSCNSNEEQDDTIKIDDIEDNNISTHEKKFSCWEKRKPMFLAVLYGFLAASLSFSFVLGI